MFGIESLVQSRPILTSGPGQPHPIEDLLRTPSNCTVAVYSSGVDHGARPRDVVRTARFRRWVLVAAHRPLDEQARADLIASLPPFLARDATPQPDVDLLLLRFLAALHERGAFRPTLAPAEDIQAAMRHLHDEIVQDDLNMMLSDGATLGVVHTSGCMVMIEPEAPRPARTFRVTPVSEPGPTVSMLTWNNDIPDEPFPRSERIQPGIFTISCMRPTHIQRFDGV